jgi:hypothetical protein
VRQSRLPSGETVLFDSPYVPTLYNGVALDPSATYFRAQTYFKNTGSAISNIISPDLRSDLSINFVAGTGRGYLTGTPTSTGSASYTIRAINSNLVSRDISVPITVTNDTVTITGIDTCYNFVLSRPSSLALAGYYTTNIQFSANCGFRKASDIQLVWSCWYWAFLIEYFFQYSPACWRPVYRYTTYDCDGYCNVR